MTFYWFDLLRFFVALLLIGSSVWMLVKHEKNIRADLAKPSFRGLMLRLTPALICIIMLIFTPVRLTVGDRADRTIQTYDSEQIFEEIIIDRHKVDQYTPGSNQDKIERITNQQED